MPRDVDGCDDGRRMKTYVALLRGINVGGMNILPMKELAALLEDLGARKVKTYIQSGNVVFRGEQQDPSLFSGRISAEIRKRRGFEPDVLLLDDEELDDAMAANPFPEAADVEPDHDQIMDYEVN